MIRTLLALAIVAGTTSLTLAQTEAPATPPATSPASSDTTVKTTRRSVPLTVFGLLSLPQGDFADEQNGAAKTGFGLGAEFAMPLQGSQATELRLGVSYIHNSMDVSEIEDYFVSVEADGWTNISFLGGIRHYFKGMPDGLYLQAMAGWNMASPGDLTFDDGNTEFVQSGSFGSAFAFSLGAGMRRGPLDFSLRYMNMGEPEIELKVKEDGELLGKTKFEQKISMLVLTVGYSF